MASRGPIVKYAIQVVCSQNASSTQPSELYKAFCILQIYLRLCLYLNVVFTSVEWRSGLCVKLIYCKWSENMFFSSLITHQDDNKKKNSFGMQRDFGMVWFISIWSRNELRFFFVSIELPNCQTISPKSHTIWKWVLCVTHKQESMSPRFLKCAYICLNSAYLYLFPGTLRATLWWS